jgi:hypothetical protein
MTLAKAKAKTNETFIVQASLVIVTYNRQNMFIVQATGFVLQAHVCSRYDDADNAATNKRSSLLRRQKVL